MHVHASGLDQRPGRPTYDSGRDPRVANVFATAAFRFGHSLVPSALMYGDRPIPLHQVFNNPKWVREDVDKVLKGLLLGQAQVRDQFFVAGNNNTTNDEDDDSRLFMVPHLVKPGALRKT